MIGFLLDTVAVSEFSKPRRNEGVGAWLANTDESLLFLSVLTIAEIRYGVLSHPDSRFRDRFSAWFDGTMLPRFSDRVVPFDRAAADRWAHVRADARKRRVTLPTVDAQIASSALSRGLTVVTRNIDDFSRCGVATLNPWT